MVKINIFQLIIIADQPGQCDKHLDLIYFMLT